MRIKKLKMEIESARRRKRNGIHPIDVLDNMVSYMFSSMKHTLNQMFPEESEEEIKRRMRKQIEIYDKKKHKG